MTKHINKGLIAINIVFYVITLTTLFGLVKVAGQAHIVPWIFAICSGLVAIAHSGYIVYTNKNMKCYLNIVFLIIINLSMVVFSILDIAHIDNHLISTITFVVVPPISISALLKL